MADYSVSKIDVSDLRKILVQAITNTDFLKQIRAFASPAILDEPFSRNILTWCYEYYDEYKQAPQNTIQQIYERKKEYVLREEDAEAIENILASLSEQLVVHANTAYYVNLAEQYFNKVAIHGLEKKLSRLADKGRIDEALNEIAKFRKVEKLNPQGVDLLKSDEAIVEAFTESQDVLFHMQGDLGALLGSFNRGDLSAVLAPMKRGKCITNSYIVTNNGIEQIRDMVDGYGCVEKIMSVATKDGIENTSHTYSELVNHTYAIRLKNGVRIEGTPEHPLYSLSNGRMDYVELQNLDRESSVATKIGTNLYGSYDDVVMAEMLGYLIANGSYNGGFVFSTYSEILQKRVQELANNIVPDSCTIAKDKKSCYLRKQASDIIHTAYGRNWSTARFKVVPDCILQGTKRVYVAFLHAMMDCESYYYNDGRTFEYSTASKDLCYGVYAMLANMGIKSTIQEGYNKQYNHIYFSLYIAVEDMKEIYEIPSLKYGDIDFSKNSKQRYNLTNFVPTFVWDEFRAWRNEHVYTNTRMMKDGSGKFDISSDILQPFRKAQLLTENTARMIADSKYIDKNLMLYKVAKMILDGFWFQKITDIEEKHEQVMVYDLTVPNGHSFIANSIVSHNTFAMMDIASTAMQTGCKVWFISLEMTKNQVIRRLWQQWTGSIASDEEDIIEPRFESGNIILEPKHVYKLSARNMMRIRNKLQTNMRTSGFKVFSYPKNTFKVSDLRILIENSIAYNNELPDFITIDYASIMQPEANKDKRFELDQIWSDLSAIAEEYNIHILTASQTNKAGFTRDIQQGDSAEANSITAHVAKMFALNQNPTNKRQHVMRYAMMFNRHQDFDTDRQVVVLQNLACGKSMIDSMWMENVKNLWKEEKKKENEEDGRNFG